MLIPEQESELAYYYAKDKCVICEVYIKDKEENYFVRGNYCASCNAKFTGKKFRNSSKNKKLTLSDLMKIVK